MLEVAVIAHYSSTRHYNHRKLTRPNSLCIQLSEATSKKQCNACEQLDDWYSKNRDVLEENRKKNYIYIYRVFNLKVDRILI
jgi:hypothetical protein